MGLYERFPEQQHCFAAGSRPVPLQWTKLGFSQSVPEEQHLRCLALLPLCQFLDMPEVQAEQDSEQQHYFVPGWRPVPL